MRYKSWTFPLKAGTYFGVMESALSNAVKASGVLFCIERTIPCRVQTRASFGVLCKVDSINWRACSYSWARIRDSIDAIGAVVFCALAATLRIANNAKQRRWYGLLKTCPESGPLLSRPSQVRNDTVGFSNCRKLIAFYSRILFSAAGWPSNCHISCGGFSQAKVEPRIATRVETGLA